MNEPVDEKLYAKTKAMVDKIYDKPSAFRSMAYSRFYMRAFREKYGLTKRPYKGSNQPGELEKWRREKWIDVRSYLENPKDPQSCGSVESKKYAFCMPQSNLKKYSNTELIALLNRKEEIESKRLVKEPYLRDLGLSKRNKTVRAVKKPFKRETRIEPPKAFKREVPKSILKELEPEPKPRKRETRIEPPKAFKREERVRLPKTITKEIAKEKEPSEEKEIVFYDKTDKNKMIPSKEFSTGNISFD